MLQTILNVFISPRFKAFYWLSAMATLAGFIDLLIQNLSDFNLPNTATVILGFVLAQASKAIANYREGKPMGFKE